MSERRHAWIDASAGVAGDMLLGALLDAGASEAVVAEAVGAVSGGAARWHSRQVRRAGLRALKVDVEILETDPPERTWRDVRNLLEQAGLPRPVEQRSAAVFRRLAEAEAHVHGITPDEVHFHEVGALDAIADVVGCCAALADLGIDTVSAGPVALGSGSVHTRHGRLPVPAPAVAELARGWQVSATGRPATAGSDGELATPTGMALLRTLAEGCEPLPPMLLEAIGVGAGTRDPSDHANIVRVLVGTTTALATKRESPVHSHDGDDTSGRSYAVGDIDVGSPEVGGERGGQVTVVVEANVDDLDPRLWPGILAGMLELGAGDAWLVPILMKKGRPAHTLSVLCEPGLVGAVRERIFRDTSTLGVRHSRRERVVLEREFVEVPVGDSRVSVKIAHRDGVLVQVMPEFEDVAALARRRGLPERVVLQEALTAAAQAGLVVGASTDLPRRPSA